MSVQSLEFNSNSNYIPQGDQNPSTVETIEVPVLDISDLETELTSVCSGARFSTRIRALQNYCAIVAPGVHNLWITKGDQWLKLEISYSLYHSEAIAESNLYEDGTTPQFYQLITVNLHDEQQSDRKVLVIRVDPNGEIAELVSVHRQDTITGTDAMQLYSKLMAVLRPKQVLLFDDSHIGGGRRAIPLFLLNPLKAMDGTTLYGKYGFRPIDCRDWKLITSRNAKPVTQDDDEYNAALNRMRTTEISALYARSLRYPVAQRVLRQLTQKYFQEDARTSTTTLQQLVAAVANARSGMELSDLFFQHIQCYNDDQHSFCRDLVTVECTRIFMRVYPQ